MIRPRDLRRKRQPASPTGNLQVATSRGIRRPGAPKHRHGPVVGRPVVRQHRRCRGGPRPAARNHRPCNVFTNPKLENTAPADVVDAPGLKDTPWRGRQHFRVIFVASKLTDMTPKFQILVGIAHRDAHIPPMWLAPLIDILDRNEARAQARCESWKTAFCTHIPSPL